jgi:hypothetical protein
MKEQNVPCSWWITVHFHRAMQMMIVYRHLLLSRSILHLLYSSWVRATPLHSAMQGFASRSENLALLQDLTCTVMDLVGVRLARQHVGNKRRSSADVNSAASAVVTAQQQQLLLEIACQQLPVLTTDQIAVLPPDIVRASQQYRWAVFSPLGGAVCFCCVWAKWWTLTATGVTSSSSGRVHFRTAWLIPVVAWSFKLELRTPLTALLSTALDVDVFMAWARHALSDQAKALLGHRGGALDLLRQAAKMLQARLSHVAQCKYNAGEKVGQKVRAGPTLTALEQQPQMQMNALAGDRDWELTLKACGSSLGQFLLALQNFTNVYHTVCAGLASTSCICLWQTLSRVWPAHWTCPRDAQHKLTLQKR